MKYQILNNQDITSLGIALVWEFHGFPNLENLSDVPADYAEPDYIYIKSGRKSGVLDFLRYATEHDTMETWNPADRYGPGILETLGTDPVAYQELEEVLLPEIKTVVTSDDDTETEEKTKGEIRFFSTTPLSGTNITLLRLPPKTWRVEFYCNPEDYDGKIYEYSRTTPVLTVTYGPGPELRNNNNDMYKVIDEDFLNKRTESVLDSEYKKMLDELESAKILAVRFSSESQGVLNLSSGSWATVETEYPERHKLEHYLGKVTLLGSKEVEVVEKYNSNIVLDKLSGVILGTRNLESSPILDLIYKLVPYQTWSPHIHYRLGDKAYWNGRLIESRTSDNIANDPDTSENWKFSDLDDFSDPIVRYTKFDISTEGNGKVYLPTGSEVLGPVTTTRDYVRLKIVPDIGYILKGLYTYSYQLGRDVSNLVAEADGTYILKNPLEIPHDPTDPQKYSYCIMFEKLGLTVVTEFYVPGPNYYTYLSPGTYHDNDVTYNSLSGITDSENIQSLPMCTDMAVTHTIEHYVPRSSGPDTWDSVPLEDFTFGVLDGISLNVSESQGFPQADQFLGILYHGLLEYYDLVGTPELTSYRGPVEVRKQKPSQGYWVDGTGLKIRFCPSESVYHLKITLAPKPIVLSLTSDTDMEPSTKKLKINRGMETIFKVYSPSGRVPVVVTSGTASLERIENSNVWTVTLVGVTESETIKIR